MSSTAKPSAAPKRAERVNPQERPSSSTSTPTSEKEPVKVYIATPAYGGMLHVSYVVSLLNLRALGCDFMYDVIGNESLIQRARNILVARFLQSECTHILFIDADIMFPPVAIQRLLQGAASGKEVVAGAYAKKSHRWNQFADKLKRGEHKGEHPEPLASMGLDYNVNLDRDTVAVDDGFVRVLDTATGFMLISRKVIEKLMAAHPEWEMVNDIEHSGGPKVEKYHGIFDVIKDPVTSRCLSEDYALCRRLQKMNVDIWVDFTTTLAHHGNNTFHADINSSLTA